MQSYSWWSGQAEQALWAALQHRRVPLGPPSFQPPASVMSLMLAIYPSVFPFVFSSHSIVGPTEELGTDSVH